MRMDVISNEEEVMKSKFYLCYYSGSYKVKDKANVDRFEEIAVDFKKNCEKKYQAENDSLKEENENLK